MKTLIASPLLRTVNDYPTDYWNDSCAVEELRYAIENGATGATSNPTIAGEVMKKEWATWQPRVLENRGEHPTWSEFEIAWRLYEEMAVRGAEQLFPVFVREGGRKGRLSIQTDPMLHRDSARMLEQGRRFHSLAPNIQVKFAATKAGLAALEEATYQGVSINATVCFALPQAIAVAEGVERALMRRERAGLDTESMSPVVTIMMGRLEDWLKVLAERDGIVVDPAAISWAGVAVVKKAHPIWRSRGYRARLLAAAYRHHLHWSELIGGDLILTMPAAWQRRFNASNIEVRSRIDDPVDPAIVDQLVEHFPDFRRAYDEDGLTVDEFDSFPPTVRTLRQFTASWLDLVRTVQDIVLPDPDKR